MAGITIVDESESVFGGTRSPWNHWNSWNSTRLWTKAGKLGLSYTDICFIVFIVILVSMALFEYQGSIFTTYLLRDLCLSGTFGGTF
jgi:hypothetical protein